MRVTFIFKYLLADVRILKKNQKIQKNIKKILKNQNKSEKSEKIIRKNIEKSTYKIENKIIKK